VLWLLGKKLKQEYALERVKLEAIRDHMIKYV
jgi:hypothetical protein